MYHYTFLDISDKWVDGSGEDFPQRPSSIAAKPFAGIYTATVLKWCSYPSATLSCTGRMFIPLCSLVRRLTRFVQHIPT